jgi:hypothetical protein
MNMRLLIVKHTTNDDVSPPHAGAEDELAEE